MAKDKHVEETRGRKPILTLAMMNEAFTDNLTRSQVAVKFGVSYDTVSRYCRKHDVDLKRTRTGRVTNTKVEVIIELWLMKQTRLGSLKSIANDVGTSPQYVSQVKEDLKDRGIRI